MRVPVPGRVSVVVAGAFVLQAEIRVVGRLAIQPLVVAFELALAAVVAAVVEFGLPDRRTLQ